MYRYQIPTMSRKHMNKAVYEISHLYLKDWRSNIVIFSWLVWFQNTLISPLKKRTDPLTPSPPSVRSVRFHLMALIGWFP